VNLPIESGPVPLPAPEGLVFFDDTNLVSMVADERASGYSIRVTGAGVKNPTNGFIDVTPELNGRDGVTYADINLDDFSPALELQNGALKIEVFFKGDGTEYSNSSIAEINVTNSERSVLGKVAIEVDFSTVSFYFSPPITGCRFKVTGAGVATPMADFLPIAYPEGYDPKDPDDSWYRTQQVNLAEIPGLSFKPGAVDITVIAEDSTGRYKESVSTYTLPAEPIFKGMGIATATVNEPYSESVAVMKTFPWSRTDIEFTYALKSGAAVPAGFALPAGLTLSPDGTVSGIPTKSVKNICFVVVATADGVAP